MLKFINRIRERKDSPAFSVLYLAGGTALGQGILVLASPFLSRLYRPEDFGLLAVYASLLGIFTVVAGGRYELAIPLPEKEEDARGLLKISLSLVLLTTLCTAVLVIVAGHPLAKLMKAPSLGAFLWLLPIGILFSGAYQALSYLVLRRKGFPLMARTRVYQGGGSSGVQLLLGLLKVRPLGLFVGQIVGQGAGIASLWRSIRKTQPERPEKSQPARSLAKRYSRFPLLSTWGAVFNALSTQLPVIFLAALFGPMVTGFYALGLRVLQTPLNLFGTAIGQVFFSEAAQAHREGRLVRVVEKGFSKLLPLGCSLLLPLAVTAPEVFSLVFGPPWRTAGVYAQMLAPWILLNLIISPLSTLTTVLERQDAEMIFQSSFLLARLGALFIGKHLGGATVSLAAFAFVSALWLGIYTFWIIGLIHIRAAIIGRLFFRACLPLVPIIIVLVTLKIVYPSGAGKDILISLMTAGFIVFRLYSQREELSRT